MNLDLAEELRYEAYADPIQPVNRGAKILSDLIWANPSRKDQDYEKIYQTLPKESDDADVSNDLGCVCAWLALKDDSYWPEALRALRRSRDANEAAAKRANHNLDVARRARDA